MGASREDAYLLYVITFVSLPTITVILKTLSKTKTAALFS